MDWFIQASFLDIVQLALKIDVVLIPIIVAGLILNHYLEDK